MTNTLNITMIGTGYVGLVSGACFAEMGWNVTCMDVDAEKIKKLDEKGEIPIYEPGLKELVDKNVAAGRLKFTTDLASCVPTSDMVFIGVGTPQDEDGSADMKYVLAAAASIAPHLNGFTVVVNKSTVPVGTGKGVFDKIKAVNPEAQFDVASNPEFLREGEAVQDFLEPDRVVVGTTSVQARAMMEHLYAPLVAKGAELFITNRESAEIIKYAANAFLAVKITYINEIAALCEAVGAHVQDVSQGMGLDSRIGAKFLQPGPGYGGSCFPKDTNAIAKTARDAGVPLKLVEETITTNQAIKERMTDKVVNACDGDVNGKTIGVLGLAFKAGTDDMRDASALTILPALHKLGATIQAYDPAAMEQAQRLMPNLTYKKTQDAAIKGADALLVLTEWDTFKTLDLMHAAKNMRGKIIIDLRNLYSLEATNTAGLERTCIG